MSELLLAGVEHLKFNRFDEAVEAFTECLKEHPDDPQALHFLGITEYRQERYEPAQKHLDAALHLQPNNPIFLHNTAAFNRTIGDRARAEQQYLRAVELKPDYAEAWFNLSSIRKWDDGQHLAPVERLLAHPDLTVEDREFALYAAARFADQCGAYDKAFQYVLDANRTRARSFNRAALRTQMDQLKTLFNADWSRHLPRSQEPTELPVFVVGMPRTGSTLVEQILSSHPAVAGAGELSDLRAVAETLREHAEGQVDFPESCARVRPQVIGALAREYLRLRTPLIQPSTERVIDKMPSNWLLVGLIAQLFPRARVIYCRRDPRDTAISCLFERFRNGQEFTDSLDDLAWYTAACDEMMDFWRRTVPVPILDLSYEYLVADQEFWTRRLIEFCGLPWDDQCLRFFETNRPVLTASASQVREPMNRRGLDRWRRYETQIAEFDQALADYRRAG